MFDDRVLSLFVAWGVRTASAERFSHVLSYAVLDFVASPSHAMPTISVPPYRISPQQSSSTLTIIFDLVRSACLMNPSAS